MPGRAVSSTLLPPRKPFRLWTSTGVVAFYALLIANSADGLSRLHRRPSTSSKKEQGDDADEAAGTRTSTAVAGVVEGSCEPNSAGDAAPLSADDDTGGERHQVRPATCDGEVRSKYRQVEIGHQHQQSDQAGGPNQRERALRHCKNLGSNLAQMLQKEINHPSSTWQQAARGKRNNDAVTAALVSAAQSFIRTCGPNAGSTISVVIRDVPVKQMPDPRHPHKFSTKHLYSFTFTVLGYAVYRESRAVVSTLLSAAGNSRLPIDLTGVVETLDVLDRSATGIGGGGDDNDGLSSPVPSASPTSLRGKTVERMRIRNYYAQVVLFVWHTLRKEVSYKTAPVTPTSSRLGGKVQENRINFVQQVVYFDVQTYHNGRSVLVSGTQVHKVPLDLLYQNRGEDEVAEPSSRKTNTIAGRRGPAISGRAADL